MQLRACPCCGSTHVRCLPAARQDALVKIIKPRRVRSLHKLRVLIVEDDSQRYAIFDKIFANHDVTKATRAAVGCAWLHKDRAAFDLIMLDHDLELTHYTMESVLGTRAAGTGQEVAHAIARLDTPPMVVVHSLNPGGAAAICVILADAGVPHHRVEFSRWIGADLHKLGILRNSDEHWERVS